MEHFREHTAMFNGRLDVVYDELVSQQVMFSPRNFLNSHPRLKDLKDRV